MWTSLSFSACEEAMAYRRGVGGRSNGAALWHSGEGIGFRSVIVRSPKQKLTVVVLRNRNDPEPYALALQIARRWQAPQR